MVVAHYYPRTLGRFVDRRDSVVIFLLCHWSPVFVRLRPWPFSSPAPSIRNVWLVAGVDCFVISIYYAVVIAWALSYLFFSFDLAWAVIRRPSFARYLHLSDEVTLKVGLCASKCCGNCLQSGQPALAFGSGVQKGIARISTIFIPLLFVMFGFLVLQALLLPSASKGLMRSCNPIGVN